jgi:hypothetical protein
MFVAWVVTGETASNTPGRPDPEPDEGPGLTWRQLTPATGPAPGTASFLAPSLSTPKAGSRTSGSRTHPGLSPIMTVGRYDSAEEAQVATDAVWVSR